MTVPRRTIDAIRAAETLDAAWALWSAAGRPVEGEDALVVAGESTVRYVLSTMSIGGDHDVPSLEQEGRLGLLEAVRKFDPEKGEHLRTYASMTVMNRVRDQMRRGDRAVRSLSRRAAQLDAAEQALMGRLGRMPTDLELAGRLTCTLDDVSGLRREILVREVEPVTDATTSTSTIQQADHGFDFDQIRARMHEALAPLQGPDRVVFVLYYIEELSMAEIARLLGVSDATVSNIRDRANRTTRERMRQI